MNPYRVPRRGLWRLLLCGAPPLSAQQDAAPPEFSIIAHLQELFRKNKPRLQVPVDPAHVPEWRERFAERLSEVLGLPGMQAAPLNPRVTGRERRDGYRIERIVYTSEEGVDVPGLLLIPDCVTPRNPAPAALCLHGGNPGAKDELAGEVTSVEIEEGLREFHDDYARQLARRGVIAFAIDLRNYGERQHRARPDPFGMNDRSASSRVLAAVSLFLGRTYFGMNVFDARRAMDYLLERPEVANGAVGCAGFSMGGNIAAWLSVIDRRVRVAALEGNWASWNRLFARDPRLATRIRLQMMPGFFLDLDYNLSLAAVAPTPMVVSFEYETEGWQFRDRSEAAADTEPVQRAYAAFGASGQLKLELVKGPHRWREEVIVPWFTAELARIAKNQL